MSGTAALAAARRRRANPANAPISNTISNQNVREEVKNMKEEIPKINNPAALLMQHHSIINKMQKEINELKEKSKENTLKENVKDDLNYKTEYLGLLEEMKEMKKVLLKVQSFSMETNLDVMKLKRAQDVEKERVDKLEKVRVELVERIESVDIVERIELVERIENVDSKLVMNVDMTNDADDIVNNMNNI
jgi:hypothetical protein